MDAIKQAEEIITNYGIVFLMNQHAEDERLLRQAELANATHNMQAAMTTLDQLLPIFREKMKNKKKANPDNS